MENKTLGIILIVISVLILITTIIYKIQVDSLVSELMETSGGECVINGDCVHQKSSLPLYLGSILFVLSLGVGIYLLIFDKKTEKKETKKIEIPKNIYEEEKKIINVLNSKGGSAYQSDLIKETEFSKVKITRVLDKLEHRKIIERKRRGMANLVVLK